MHVEHVPLSYRCRAARCPRVVIYLPQYATWRAEQVGAATIQRVGRQFGAVVSVQVLNECASARSHKAAPKQPEAAEVETCKPTPAAPDRAPEMQARWPENGDMYAGRGFGQREIVDRLSRIALSILAFRFAR